MVQNTENRTSEYVQARNLPPLRDNRCEIQRNPKSFEGLLVDITKQPSETEKYGGIEDVVSTLNDLDWQRKGSDLITDGPNLITLGTNSFNVKSPGLKVF